MFSPLLDKVTSCALVLCTIYCFNNITPAQGYKDGIDRDLAGSDDAYKGGMWFGPRLGKRSLRLNTEIDRQAFYRMLEAADALKYYYNKLPFYETQDEPETRVTKKIIFTPKLGRRALDEDERKADSYDFTPRLGRRLTDDPGVTPPGENNYRNDPDQLESRSKYFSPRLGRNNNNYTPRLGRDLIYDVFPPDANIRVVRSVPKENMTKT